MASDPYSREHIILKRIIVSEHEWNDMQMYLNVSCHSYAIPWDRAVQEYRDHQLIILQYTWITSNKLSLPVAFFM